MLAPNWHPDHAVNAKILVIKLPNTDQVVYHGFLRSATAKFRDVAGILNHGHCVEICAQGKGDCEEQIECHVLRECCLKLSAGRLTRLLDIDPLLNMVLVQQSPTQNRVAANTPDRYGCFASQPIVTTYFEYCLTVL